MRAGRLENITSIQWRDQNSLWFAGWQKLGAVHGVVGLDGAVESEDHEDGIVGTTSFLASILPEPAGEVSLRYAKARAAHRRSSRERTEQ